MNPAPLPNPVNSNSAPAGLRAGQIPTLHFLLDFDDVEAFSHELEDSLARLEERYASYVTDVSTKSGPRA